MTGARLAPARLDRSPPPPTGRRRKSQPTRRAPEPGASGRGSARHTARPQTPDNNFFHAPEPSFFRHPPDSPSLFADNHHTAHHNQSHTDTTQPTDTLHTTRNNHTPTQATTTPQPITRNQHNTTQPDTSNNTPQLNTTDNTTNQTPQPITRNHTTTNQAQPRNQQSQPY